MRSSFCTGPETHGDRTSGGDRSLTGTSRTVLLEVQIRPSFYQGVNKCRRRASASPFRIAVLTSMLTALRLLRLGSYLGASLSSWLLAPCTASSEYGMLKVVLLYQASHWSM